MLLSQSIKLAPCFYTHRNTACLLCPREDLTYPARISTKNPSAAPLLLPLLWGTGGKEESPVALHWRRPRIRHWSGIYHLNFQQGTLNREEGWKKITQFGILWLFCTITYSSSIGTYQQVRPSPTVTLLQFSLALTHNLDHQPASFQPCVLPCHSHRPEMIPWKCQAGKGRQTLTPSSIFIGSVPKIWLS